MLRTLIGIRLRAAFCSLTGKKKNGGVSRPSVGKIILFSLIYLYVCAVFFGLFAMMAFSLGSFLLPNYAELYFGFFMLITFSILFIFSVFHTKSEIFDCKDNDLLLSMPIPPKYIVASRVLTVLIFNYIEAAVVFIPALIAYLFFGGPVGGYFGGAMVLLLLPLLATAVASFFGFLLAHITKRLKSKTLFTVLFSLLFLVGYAVVYFYLMNNGEGLLEDIAGNIDKLAENLGFIGAIGAAATFSPVSALVFFAVSLGGAFCAYYVISRNYVSIVTSKTAVKRTEYRARRAENKGAIFALISKEMRTFFSSATYIMNGCVGLIMALLLAVVGLVERNEIKSAKEMLSGELGYDASGLVAVLMICGVMLCLSTVMISASAVSLEGKRLWIIRSLPVTPKQVLVAKTTPHVIISLPLTLVSSVVLFIASGSSVVYLPFFVLVPVSFSVMTALSGTVFNVAFPKFEFDNEAQPIKQSMASFLAMMSSMVYVIAAIGVGMLVSILLSGVVACVALLIFNALLSLLFWLLISGPMSRRFARFD